MAILERLFFTRNSSWVRRCRACVFQMRVLLLADSLCRAARVFLHRQLEEHIDYISLQALLFKESSMSIWQQTRLFFSHTKRVA